MAVLPQFNGGAAFTPLQQSYGAPKLQRGTEGTGNPRGAYNTSFQHPAQMAYSNQQASRLQNRMDQRMSYGRPQEMQKPLPQLGQAQNTPPNMSPEQLAMQASQQNLGSIDPQEWERLVQSFMQSRQPLNQGGMGAMHSAGSFLPPGQSLGAPMPQFRPAQDQIPLGAKPGIMDPYQQGRDYYPYWNRR